MEPSVIRKLPAFLTDIFFQNPYVQYNLRNRSVIPIEVFTTYVEALFGRFFVTGNMKYMDDAMRVGINPLFAFNMVTPFFLRIINNTMHERIDQTVFEKVPTTRYYLSFTILEKRYRELLTLPQFMTPFAFVQSDEFAKSMDDIFTIFRHIGEEEIDLSGIRADLTTAFDAARTATRAKIVARMAPLKKELLEMYYHPDRIWKCSQAISMFSWDYLEIIR